jgi:hypothetical protein
MCVYVYRCVHVYMCVCTRVHLGNVTDQQCIRQLFLGASEGLFNCFIAEIFHPWFNVVGNLVLAFFPRRKYLFLLIRL